MLHGARTSHRLRTTTICKRLALPFPKQVYQGHQQFWPETKPLMTVRRLYAASPLQARQDDPRWPAIDIQWKCPGHHSKRLRKLDPRTRIEFKPDRLDRVMGLKFGQHVGPMNLDCPRANIQ